MARRALLCTLLVGAVALASEGASAAPRLPIAQPYSEGALVKAPMAPFANGMLKYYGGRVIWGATGRILKHFLDIFRDA